MSMNDKGRGGEMRQHEGEEGGEETDDDTYRNIKGDEVGN